MTLDSMFNEMKYHHFSKQQIIKGWGFICCMQTPLFFLKIGWELITTFIIYSPSVNNYSKDLICSVRKDWENLTIEKKLCVIAVLASLNKHGKIDEALKKY